MLELLLKTTALLKGTALFASMSLIALEPAITPVEPDFWRYAITQGGLFAVVCVLLWSYRRDFIRIQDRDSEKLALLAGLIEKSVAAMSTVTAALVSQEQTTARLEQTVDRLVDKSK